MFEGFTREAVPVAGGAVTLSVRHGGSGPAVLLLHGHPRTSATWHAVAPLLAASYSVVCPDLRGYGASSKPPTTHDHAPYSKRAMAADCLDLMRALGHDSFAVVGHDRGAYVALRTALDFADAVTALVVLDAVPIGEALRRCDAAFARSWWHWFFLGNPAARAHEVISADADFWYRTADKRAQMPAEVWAEYRAAVNDPATVLAMCEDYRAGLGIDRAHDDADMAAGRRVRCPTLVGWALQDDMEELYGDPLAVWSSWSDDLRGATYDCGHHIAEELPHELATDLLAFLA